MNNSAHSADDNLDQKLSARLQDLRAGRSWTLDELAQSSGISRPTLSRIERGETSPTATQLGRLCSAFNITMSRLLSGLDAPADDMVPLDRQATWIDPATGFRRRAVSPPGEGLRIELVEGELPAGAVISYDAPPVPGLEQHVWLLSGSLCLSYGETIQTLAPGDCLRFHLWGHSRFEVPGSVPARYLIAVCRPS